jgi:hypothetical protein
MYLSARTFSTKRKKTKKIELFQVEDSDLLALKAASSGNALPTDIPQYPQRLDPSATPL